MSIPTILLVDDDEVEAEAIRRAFRQSKLMNPLLHVTDGLSALELLRGASGVAPLPKPYIILLDINMPRMNGLEFLYDLRQDSDLKDSVVFVLTTSTSSQDKVFAYEQQIAGYILKQNVGQDFVNALLLLNDSQPPVVFSD
jgi:CheY-like chemotaxis protein